MPLISLASGRLFNLLISYLHSSCPNRLPIVYTIIKIGHCFKKMAKISRLQRRELRMLSHREDNNTANRMVL